MERIEGKRILVTGATGQVAGLLTEQLALHNEVHAAARFTDAKAKAALESKGVRTVYFSMGEADLSGLPDVDYVFHCGCNTSPKSPEIGMAQNAEGTGFLMQRYRKAVAFFHMSSSSVYRVPSGSAVPTQETDLLGGFSVYGPHYAMSKLATEAVVRFQARALALPTLIARLDVAAPDAWMIGDGPQDIAAGKAAGCFTVAIPGIAERQHLVASGADLFCESFHELREELQRLTARPASHRSP